MHPEGGYSSKELSPTTWRDFESLFAKHNGVWGGCWCMWSGTVSMFANAGFEVASQLGKSSVVMQKTI